MRTEDVNRLIKQAEQAAKDKREWVGLTPQEFNKIKDTASTIGYAIIQTEAKLREKNSP